MKFVKLIKASDYNKNFLVALYNQLVNEKYINVNLWHNYIDNNITKHAKFATSISAQKLEAKCSAVIDILPKLLKKAKIYTDLSQLVNEIYSNSINNGGASVYVETGLNAVISGYMVAKENSKEAVISESNFSPKFLEEYIKQNARELKQDNTFLGTWNEGGKWYIDSSERIKSCILAMYLAIQRNELAIYDLVHGESIYTKDFKNVDFSKAKNLWKNDEKENYQSLLNLKMEQEKQK